ncbi:MAG: ATP-dependent DNA helicase RecG [Oscillospiraceae bacterium]|nr:ATP-dependent DNA helicase RecG [Oscillospiraceae bacterium]
MAKLYDSILTLPGIGPKKAELFAQLGVHTLADLLACFPRAYEDRTRLSMLYELQEETPACFEAMVISEPRTTRIRKGLEITQVRVADETGRLNLTFFNQKYTAGQLHYGESYLFYGVLDSGSRGRSMSNPAFEPVAASGETTNCILPVYSLTAGLSNKALRKAVTAALELVLPQLEELLPEALLVRYDLCGIRDAYETIHRPKSFEALERAKKRLVFEEFFLFSCGLSLLRSKRTAASCRAFANCDLGAFYASLPFTLTRAQQRAIDEIRKDLSAGTPMNRLLQGDVGSGKTMVAAAAMVCAAQSGMQAALMAPTEILAEQHLKSLSPMLEKLGIRAALLTGSMTAAQKRAVKAQIEGGEVQVIIGTHALFSHDVTYCGLGLIIADEQHRFGVAQRDALVQKGIHPHILVMSATPIPRTLALILYGDLDISVLNEKPAGRESIDTFLVDESMRQRINAFIRKHAAAGHQIYIVCPAVEEDEENSLKSVETWSETLQKVVFPDLRVGLLHGQMKAADKEAAMRAFASGRDDILVATTVIEVGVDVPNATLIVIENAERFGLSQLHQLRGRVGRGHDKSFCVMFSSAKNPDTLRRLKALCSTNDGFKIAEEDLAQRGPGDFFGARQSGLPVFRVANLMTDLDVLQTAKAAADEFLTGTDITCIPEALRLRIQALFANCSGNLN